MVSTLFTAAIVLGLLFLFIIFFVQLHKKKDNKKLANQKVIISDLIWKNNLEISEQEGINNCFFAIDKINFVLLYVHFQNNTHEAQLIDLWNVKSAKISLEDNCVYEYKKGKSVLSDKQLDKLFIELSFINNPEKMPLLIYDLHDGLLDLLQIKSRANHWAQVINSCVEGVPHKKKNQSA